MASAPPAGSVDQWPAGEVVGDGYVVERYVAGGGMGQVYVARDARLDRLVALKRMNAAAAASSEGARRFQQEALALSRVVHPNVVTIHAFGRHGQDWYLAMEFIDGEALDAVLRARRLSVAEAVGVACQAAAALAEAHALGIVHRDVKPGNILVRRLATGGTLVKVVDFGLARSLAGDSGTLTRDNALLGTPLYMAPEQIRGDALDGRCDQYALGVVLYQMLTGRVPFVRDTMESILMAHLVEPPPPPTEGELGADGSDDLQRALMRALAKDPAARFGHIAAFAEALQAALAHPSQDADRDEAPCPTCGVGVRAAQSFCGGCGAHALLTRCPVCRAPRDGARPFCVRCGASLRAPLRRRGSGDGAGLSAVLPDSGAAPRTVAVLAAVLASDGVADHDDVLPHLLAHFPTIVAREGGQTLVIVGGCAVAAFGVAGMREGEVEAALLAAQHLRAALESVLPTASVARVRCGVELGTVITTNAGVAWGLAMAAGPGVDAARVVADRAAPGGIAAGSRAWREVRLSYEASALAGGAMAIHRRSDASRVLAAYLAGSAAAPIGRDEELTLLALTARKVRRAGQLAVVPVMGAGGAGKSSLVAAWLRTLAGEAGGWQLDVGQCSPLGVPVAYEPFVAIIHARLRAHETQDAEQLLARLQRLPGLAPAGSAGEEEQTARRTRALGRLLGLEHAASAERARPASDADQHAAFEAFTAFVRACCAESPVVMVLEDLQWARAPTLSLLGHLLRTCQDIPLLVVAVLREERSDAVFEVLHQASARLVSLEVHGLERDAVATMLCARWRCEEVDPAVVEAIWAASGGNPARIEELADAVEPTRRGGAERDSAAAAAALDRPLRELVLGRIGRLPDAERALIEALAIAGHATPRSMLAAMLGRDPTEHDLEEIKRSGVVLESRAPRFVGEREFAVRQAMMTEWVAASVAPVRKAAMHRAAARWLLDWAGGRPKDFGALLAHHWMVGGEGATAARCLLDQAELAMRSLANRDAYEALAAAIELAGGHCAAAPNDAAAVATWSEAMLRRAELALHLGEPQEAVDLAQRIQRLASDHEGLALAGLQAQILHGDALRVLGAHADAIVVLEAAAQAARRLQQPVLAVLALSYCGGAMMRRGEDARVQELASAALQEARSLAAHIDGRLHAAIGRLHTWLGTVLARRGAFDDAAAHYEAALHALRAAGDESAVAMASLSLGNLAYRRGQLEQAAVVFGQVARRCQLLDFVQGQAAAQVNLAHVHFDSQRYDDALHELREAEQALRRAEERDVLPEAMGLMARALLAKGDHLGAERAATEAYELAAAMGNETLAHAWSEIARSAHKMSQMLSAQTATAGGLQVARRRTTRSLRREPDS